MRIFILHAAQKVSRAGRFSRALLAYYHHYTGMRKAVRILMEHIQNYTFWEVLEQPHKNVTPSYSRGIFALLEAQSLMSVIYQVDKAAYHERQCYSTADNEPI